MNQINCCCYFCGLKSGSCKLVPKSVSQKIIKTKQTLEMVNDLLYQHYFTTFSYKCEFIPEGVNPKFMKEWHNMQVFDALIKEFFIEFRNSHKSYKMDEELFSRLKLLSYYDLPISIGSWVYYPTIHQDTEFDPSMDHHRCEALTFALSLSSKVVRQILTQVDSIYIEKYGRGGKVAGMYWVGSEKDSSVIRFSEGEREGQKV